MVATTPLLPHPLGKPGDKDDDAEPGIAVMTAAEQKEYIESVAKEFMNMVPSSDFSGISSLGRHIRETYGRSYDWSSVQDWAESVFNTTLQTIGQPITDTDMSNYGSYTYIYNYVYTDYKALILASNYKGHFTAQNGRWTRTDASDLQFIFSDQNGQQCTLTLATSGNVKNVKAFTDEKLEWGDDYDPGVGSNIYTYTYNYNIDTYHYTIGVPEHIEAILTQGGSQVAKITINTELGSISNEEFNIATNNVTLSAQAELNNGYNISFQQFAYTGNSNVSASAFVSKNGNQLLTLAVSGNPSGLPSITVEELAEKFPDAINSNDVNLKNAYVKVDVLNKLQLQGTLSDVQKFAEYLNTASDNRYDEATYKSYITQANSLANIFVTYSKTGSITQAKVRLEAFGEQIWSGQTKWRNEPVLVFSDGASYSTFAAFFNASDFRQTSDMFKDLADKYMDMLGIDRSSNDEDVPMVGYPVY